ncbi:MAG: ABC transporter permease [Gemmatimonadota bacterium]
MTPFNSKVRAILRREYLQRVRSKWFLLSTLGLPLLFVGFAVLSGFLATGGGAEVSTLAVGVVDRSGALGDLVVEELLRDSVLAATLPELDDADDTGVRQALLGSTHDLYLVLPAALAAGAVGGDASEEAPPEARLLARDNVSSAASRTIRDALNRALVRARLRSAGIEGVDPTDLLRSVRLDVTNVTEEGSTRSQEAFQAISFVIAFLFYMVLIIYGQMIIRSIIEEKTTDIVEVMVSSVRPWELMLGKIVGVGAVGITQLAIWGIVMAGLIVFGASAASPALAEAGVDLSAVRIPWALAALILVFLVLGYLLYAGLFAGAGATIGSEQDAQQVALPIIMLIVIPFIAARGVIESPTATWSIVMSLVPFFSPLLMPSRLLVSAVPAWQLAAALVLLVAFILGAAWVAGRVYRVGILMKGQRPNLPEVVRWIRHG